MIRKNKVIVERWLDMDWNTLLTFALGALATLIPVIISNIHQSKEREKDRIEHRKDAKIQAREKWEEKDILSMIDSINALITNFSEEGVLILNYSNLAKKIVSDSSEVRNVSMI